MIWRRLRTRREDSTEPGEPLALARERMVAEQIAARGLTDPELLRAFRIVPRHRFVDSVGPYAARAPRRGGRHARGPRARPAGGAERRCWRSAPGAATRRRSSPSWEPRWSASSATRSCPKRRDVG